MISSYLVHQKDSSYISSNNLFGCFNHLLNSYSKPIIMKKTVLFRALPLLALFGLLCTGAWAQSSAFGKAPSTPQEREEAQLRSYQQIKLSRKAAAESSTQQATKTVYATKNAQSKEQMADLYAEMKANVSNASYDMSASLKKLKSSSEVMYPLNKFDPTFPLVLRTGDAQSDNLAYNKAKQNWLNAQK